LAAGSDAERLATIRTLLEARETAYAAATHRVDTTGRSIDDVVSQIRSLVGAE
jgi:broad-specificity NMP kinase